jgi:hypothetical protein
MSAVASGEVELQAALLAFASHLSGDKDDQLIAFLRE